MTIKQLILYHHLAQQPPAVNGLPERWTPPEQQQHQRHKVPEVIQRALPGIRTRDYVAMRKRTAFLLSRTYVCEEVAIVLLKAGLEARPLLIALRCLSLLLLLRHQGCSCGGWQHVSAVIRDERML